MTWRTLTRVPVIIASLAFAMPATASPPALNECLAGAEKAQAERDAGRYRSAERALNVCASATCPSAIRQDCVSWLNDLLASSPTVVFVVHDEKGADLENVAVVVDGEVLASTIDGRPVHIDPGKHEIVFHSPNRASVKMPLLVHTAVKDRVVTVQLGPAGEQAPEAPPVANVTPPLTASTPTARDASSPLVPLLIGGGGLAAVAAGAYLWISAREDLDTILARPCAAARTCSESDVTSVRTRLVVGDVLAVAGLAAVGVGVWMWVARNRSSNAAFVIVPTGGARLVGQF